MINVVIADDHAIMRDGLRMILGGSSDINVVGEAVNGSHAITLVEKLQPHVIVMDVSMPEINGIEATRIICGRWPKTKVVMFSMYQTSEHVYQAFQAGATGYVLKESAGSCVITAIRTVLKNKTFFGEGVDEHVIVHGARKEGEKKPFDRLSARERETLQLVAEGNTNAVISEKLNVSTSTVEVYRTRLMQKLNVSNVPALVHVALDHGVISRPEECVFLERKMGSDEGNVTENKFNNILSTIMGYCHLVKTSCQTAEECIAAIETFTERSTVLSRKILSEADQGLSPDQIKVWFTASDLCVSAAKDVPKEAFVRPAAPNGKPFFNIDSDHSHSVIRSLLFATSAVLREGWSRAFLEARAVSSGQCDHSGRLITPGDYLCLDVTDSGDRELKNRNWRGLPPSQETVKLVEGMAKILEIVDPYGGVLQVSPRDKNCKFVTIYLPLEGYKKSSVSSYSGERRTILIVDDEESIRFITGMILSTLGYDVIEVADGIEALDAFQKNEDTIGAIMMDILMPNMNGYEAIKAIRQINQYVPIAVVSGQGDSESLSKIDPNSITTYLSKPYKPAELKDVMMRLIPSN